MKTETDGALAAYQQQMAVAQEMSEALLEGVDGMEHVWLEQARGMLEEQLKFFQAAIALRDPQGLAALHTTFFSHPPKELFKTQQQLLNTITETQTKISDALGKHMARLKTEAKPLWTADTEGKGKGPAGAFYSVWSKMLQDSVELASLGMKALPPATSTPGNLLVSKKEAAHAKQK